MHRRLLLAAVSVAALFATSIPSGAADLGVRQSPAYKAPVLTTTFVNPWAGFYGGFNAGYSFERFGGSDTPRISTGDGAFGVQLGYNWLASNWLFGVEGDLQTTTGHVGTASGTCGGVACTINARINGFGTVRGRVGALFDSTLVYVTGGAAFVDSGNALFGPGGAVSDDKVWRTGYTLGGGVEQMLWTRWSAKFEYLYIAANGPSLTSGAATANFDSRQHLFRAGLNYHF